LQNVGLELPKTVKRALEIDKETGTTNWRDAICKEMKNAFPAFEFLDEGAVKPIGYQQITCHLVFDIKMDFTRKACFVAGGHMTDAPLLITYASVVLRKSVCIALLIAALNDLEVAGGDVQGAYLNAPCREKVNTICGPCILLKLYRCLVLPCVLLITMFGCVRQPAKTVQISTNMFWFIPMIFCAFPLTQYRS
jgi:hypothetical protein